MDFTWLSLDSAAGLDRWQGNGCINPFKEWLDLFNPVPVMVGLLVFLCSALFLLQFRVGEGMEVLRHTCGPLSTVFSYINQSQTRPSCQMVDSGFCAVVATFPFDEFSPSCTKRIWDLDFSCDKINERRLHKFGIRPLFNPSNFHFGWVN